MENIHIGKDDRTFDFFKLKSEKFKLKYISVYTALP